MDRPPGCSKTRKTCVIFGLIGTLTFVIILVKNGFTELQTDLCNIKEHMQEMKYDDHVMQAKKDTQLQLEIIEKHLQEIKERQMQKKSNKACKGIPGGSAKSESSNDQIKELIRRALEEYGADKTGKMDFALESAGGCIVATWDTEDYDPGSRSTTLFGFPICQGENGPNALIQANVLPGQCWALKGSSGSVTIKLLGPVFVNGISLEHISKQLSPTGEIDTAPKEFSLWGLDDEDDRSGEFLGQFVYDIDGPPIQHYQVGTYPQSFELVELKIHSNHGNSIFTCVYRLRVHGILDTSKQS